MEHTAQVKLLSCLKSDSFKFLVGILLIGIAWFAFGVGLSKLSHGDSLLLQLIKLLSVCVLSFTAGCTVGFLLLFSELPFKRYALFYFSVAALALSMGLRSFTGIDTGSVMLAYAVFSSAGLIFFGIAAEKEL